MVYVQMHPLVRILQCTMQPLTTRWNSADYSAPYWRLYWNRTPGARVIWDGVATELRPENLIIIPPNTAYAAQLDQPAEHVYIHFLAQGRYRGAAPGIYVTPATPEVLAGVEAIRAGRIDAARQLLLALTLAHLALCQVPETALMQPPGDARVQKVMEFIDAQYHTAILNPQLAKIAHMNTNAMIRLFRETTGETPQAYLRRRRIDAACVQLHYSAATIEAIAADAGFCDRFHFTKVFRKLRGVGPAGFRATRERAG